MFNIADHDACRFPANVMSADHDLNHGNIFISWHPNLQNQAFKKPQASFEMIYGHAILFFLFNINILDH